MQTFTLNPSTSLANNLSAQAGQSPVAVNSSPVDSKTVKTFLGVLKKENILFDSTMHQDAHEMLNFVLNKVGEDIIQLDQQVSARRQGKRSVKGQSTNVNTVEAGGKTCVHRLFEGVLTNETRCLTCETVSRGPTLS